MKKFSPVFRRRLLIMFIAIIMMGIFMSFVIQVNYGNDTCTFMNLGISEKTGVSFGTCCLVMNAALLIPVLIFDRSLINIGTILNMTLVGYTSDFCRWLQNKYIPPEIFTTSPTRPIIFAAALIPFLISIAVYMNSDLGQVPFDAVPTLISRKLHLPFSAVRIAWDSAAVIIGILFGRKLNIGTVIMALSLGPTVSLIGRHMKRSDRVSANSCRA